MPLKGELVALQGELRRWNERSRNNVQSLRDELGALKRQVEQQQQSATTGGPNQVEAQLQQVLHSVRHELDAAHQASQGTLTRFQRDLGAEVGATVQEGVQTLLQSPSMASWQESFQQRCDARLQEGLRRWEHATKSSSSLGTNRTKRFPRSSRSASNTSSTNTPVNSSSRNGTTRTSSRSCDATWNGKRKTRNEPCNSRNTKRSSSCRN